MKIKLLISTMRGQRSCIMILPILLLAILGNGAFGQEASTMVEYASELPTIDTFSIPVAKRGPFRAFDRVMISGFHNYGNAGEPVLPYKTARILLPPGHDVESIRVILGEEISLEGEYYLEPGQVPIPTSVDTFIYTPPNPAIYETEDPFPDTLYRVLSTQNFRGYKIVLIQLCPIKYIPARKKILYYPNINVTVETKKVREENPFYRGLPKDREEVEPLIDNPEILKQYPALDESHLKRNPLPEGKWDMVIITDTTLKFVFDNYATWRTNQRGIRTIVYSIATILANYSGHDNAEKVRNFIIDAYNDWGIQYVLLGGDVDIVPHRLLRSEVWGGENIPADIYYAGLDGTWDADNDHIYGEMAPVDEADLFAEVYVGRAPVNTVAEAQNFCNKIRSYEESALDTTRCDWLFFSTILSTSVPTYGGDYKDDTEIQELNPPHGFNITKVYQHSGGTSAQVINALNAGQRIGNSCGHGGPGGFGMLTSTDVDNLTNTNYCLIYTWACWTNAFDQTTDCIGEHFLYTQHGAFAYIGNSRYGWYNNSGDAIGPSHDFELEFYDALIDENIARVGQALQDSKEEFSASPSGYHRWIYYALNLLGDPSTLLRIKHDLWIKTSVGDDSSTPVSAPWWTSPDIAVDAPNGPWQIPSPFITHENPKYNQTNRVYIRVRNPGCEGADTVTVKFYWADPAGGIPWPTAWNYVGSITIPSIPAGAEVVTPYIPWKPTGTAIGHRCVMATAEWYADPISIHSPRYDNNVAQKNVTIVGLAALPPFQSDFVINVLRVRGKRSMKITFLEAPVGATVELRIPRTVEISKRPEDKHITLIKKGVCLGIFPGEEEWRVVAASIAKERITTVAIPQFKCYKKEKICLKITVPQNVRARGKFTIRITEEIDGRTIGGLDYLVRF